MLLKSAACLLSLTSALPALPLFIGTNTGTKSPSKGIYSADFDPQSGILTQPQLAAEYQNPGFLVQHPKLPVLLCVGSPNKPFADGSSSVAAFTIAADQTLKFLGEASTGGKDACHLAVNAAGTGVAVADYGDGHIPHWRMDAAGNRHADATTGDSHISFMRLDGNGVPELSECVAYKRGSGPDKSRQEGPHAHGVYFDKTNKHLCVPDLGLDKVWVYPLVGAVTIDSPPTSMHTPPRIQQSLTTAPGGGPRHMAFSPDWKHAYVVNELDSTILAASYDGEGNFKAIQTVPTLPKDFTGKNYPAEIEVSADGRFVYASNRGHDSIAVFRRNETSGELTSTQHAPCGGKAPRHFKIAPGGKWLLCAHQDSNTISVLPLNPETGELGPPTNTVPCPSPICILFER